MCDYFVCLGTWTGGLLVPGQYVVGPPGRTVCRLYDLRRDFWGGSLDDDSYDAGAAFEEEKARLMEEIFGRSPWDDSFGAGSSDADRSDDDESICWDDEAGGE